MNREISIFLSSTFVDLQPERDYLVKRTIPMLKQYCYKRDVSLSVIDLRWGVTEEDAHTGRVVELCMDEIERTNPFFVGIVGGRYGWQPDKDYLKANERLNIKYPWVKDCLQERMSITEMEIQYGVLHREKPVNAFFFLSEGGAKFREEAGSERAQKLEKLKQSIRDHSANGGCTVDDFRTPQELGRRLYDRIKKMVDTMFPYDSISDDDTVKSIRHQEIEIERLRKIYHFHQELDYKIYYLDIANRLAGVVYGPAGIGKSAMLANWHPEGITPKGYTIVRTIVPEDCNLTSDLIKMYKQMVSSLDENQASRVVWTIDGLDTIYDGICKAVEELIAGVPETTKLIVTTESKLDAETLCRDHDAAIVEVEPLSPNDVYELLSAYLKDVGKRLSQKQLLHITQSPLLQQPLALNVFLNELIQLGEFEKLDTTIDNLLQTTTIEQLYDHLIDRMEADFGRQPVECILSSLAQYKEGVTLAMLEPNVDVQQWAAVLEAIHPVVRRNGDIVSLSDKDIITVIENRYPVDEERQKESNQAMLKLLHTLIKKTKYYDRECSLFRLYVLRLYVSLQMMFKAARWLDRHHLSIFLFSSDGIREILPILVNKRLYNPFVMPKYYFLTRKSYKALRLARKGKSVNEIDDFYKLLFQTDKTLPKTMFEKYNPDAAYRERPDKSFFDYDKEILGDVSNTIASLALQRMERWDDAEELISKVSYNTNPQACVVLFLNALHKEEKDICEDCYSQFRQLSNVQFGIGPFYQAIFEFSMIVHWGSPTFDDLQQKLNEFIGQKYIIADNLAGFIKVWGDIIEPKHNNNSDPKARPCYLIPYLWEQAALLAPEVKEKIDHFELAAKDYAEPTVGISKLIPAAFRPRFFDDANRCNNAVIALYDEGKATPDDALWALRRQILMELRKAYYSDTVTSIADRMVEIQSKYNIKEWSTAVEQYSGLAHKHCLNYGNDVTAHRQMALEHLLASCNNSIAISDEPVETTQNNVSDMLEILISNHDQPSEAIQWSQKIRSLVDQLQLGDEDKIWADYLNVFLYAFEGRCDDALTLWSDAAGRTNLQQYNNIIRLFPLSINIQLPLFVYNRCGDPLLLDKHYHPALPDGILQFFFNLLDNRKIKYPDYSGTPLLSALRQRIEENRDQWQGTVMVRCALPSIYAAEGDLETARRQMHLNLSRTIATDCKATKDLILHWQLRILDEDRYDNRSAIDMMDAVIREYHLVENDDESDIEWLIAWNVLVDDPVTVYDWDKFVEWLQQRPDPLRAIVAMPRLIDALLEDDLSDLPDDATTGQRQAKFDTALDRVEPIIERCKPWMERPYQILEGEQYYVNDYFAILLDTIAEGSPKPDAMRLRELYDTINFKPPENLPEAEDDTEDAEETTLQQRYGWMVEAYGGMQPPLSYDQFCIYCEAEEAYSNLDFQHTVDVINAMPPELREITDKGFVLNLDYRAQDTHFMLVRSLLALGRKNEAIKQWHISEDSKTYEVFALQTIILIESGLEDDARQFYQKLTNQGHLLVHGESISYELWLRWARRWLITGQGFDDYGHFVVDD